jgi:hypothetical protein
MGGFDMDFTPTSNHDFKITKQQAGIYLTCCGDEVQFYTSTEFGLPASEGWYITQASGAFNGDRFFTLAEVKTFLTKQHKKVGA